jgi:hypothetical protein
MELHLTRHAAVLGTLVLGAMLYGASAIAEQSAELTAPLDTEVQVVGPKLDPQTLNRVAMKFVESHTAVNPTVHQLGRWQMGLCPSVTGLKPAADTFVKGQLAAVARSVGVRTWRDDAKCAVNVEVVFTSEPQQLLDHIAQSSPVLLGSSRSAGDTAVRRPIQAWYLTETRSTVGFQPPADPKDENLYLAMSDATFKSTTTKIDPGYGVGAQPSGLTGSYFTKGLASDLRHVLVVVDTGKVASHSLRAVADYVAMLALTHVGSLDACNELPSIIDMLASGCRARANPQALTEADTAYLKALYSSDREKNLNLEQGDMRDRMIRTLLRK